MRLHISNNKNHKDWGYGSRASALAQQLQRFEFKSSITEKISWNMKSLFYVSANIILTEFETTAPSQFQ
jgi:hypothetical protein